MLRDWHSALKRIVILLGVLALVGFLVGRPALVLLIGVSGLLLHGLYQIHRLHRWLYAPYASERPPPESRGVWGDVFDGIYQLQRRERESREWLGGIIDKAQQSTAALDMAVVMIDNRGNLQWWNAAAEKLLGFRLGDRNQAVVNLLREPRFVEYFQEGDYETPLKLPSPVNHRLMLEFQLTWFGEGERLMLVKDITQLHRLELMRKDFVGNVSHELRTPITVITGYLETLLDNRDSIETRWIKPLEQMYQQSRRMENIIRDLLTLSRLETKAVSRQRTAIDVAALLREIRGDAEQLFSDKEHVFHVDCSSAFELRGNRNELYIALSNLAFNAAKYTGRHGEIGLSCYRVENRLAVEISDNGPGIEAQHIPRLTERFYRVDESRSSDTGGTGLGLAIVKHVLARHGASLEILSEPGSGSRFICHFPAERVMEKAA